jgi:hypothetical protein
VTKYITSLCAPWFINDDIVQQMLGALANRNQSDIPKNQMVLIPQSLTAQSTASKVSRSSSTPARNTGQAMATQTKTQQLVSPRARAGMHMGMQTTSERMLLLGNMSGPPCMLLHKMRDTSGGSRQLTPRFESCQRKEHAKHASKAERQKTA